MHSDRKVLQYYSEYDNKIVPLPYSYLQPNSEECNKLRNYVKLNFEKKSELEIAHILLNYTFKNLISGNDDYFKLKDKCNSLFVLNATRREGIKSNCYMYCVVLTELLLCYGIRSRLIVCRPFDFYKNTDCHCMVHAYIKQLGKWIALDPANCASFRDENGVFLSIPEIRRKIIEDKQYFIFCSTRDNSAAIKNYLSYYLFAFFSFQDNGFNSYSADVTNHIYALLPLFFKKHTSSVPNMDITFNDFSFWNN